MAEFDQLIQDRDKFRKAYAAEVKASAESKKRCDDLIEWTELQLQAAILSHDGQLRNTIAFKTERDALVQAIKDIKQAAIDGRVCDDVAWFDTITTLHDFCDQTLAAVAGVKQP